ncbi:YebC/PmpR family DNA-binding transcriptional regulator [Candidatus Peregrinibacteria bacterium]|nr:YebC/PmpR family DNA-binding transcriptional regulator [Candidatus Peregrinibacteria bacterium]
MSGHSKWSTIKHKKASTDKKRGKIFTKHAKLIAVAARNGGDPGHNPGLRAAIDNARAENVPVENIERAIKKGSGEGKDAVVMEEIFYEGFGPGGAALYIETLTDNRNRTLTNVKHIFTKNDGNFGSAGTVGYLFKKKGVIQVNLEEAGKNADDIELTAIDAGAEDVVNEGETIKIYTEPTGVMKAKSALEAAGIKVASASQTYVPQTNVQIADAEVARQLLKLIELIEEDEDVSEVFSNFDIAEEILEQIG